MESLLASIGKYCFVTYCRKLTNPSLSDDDITEMMIKEEGWAKSSAKNRRTRGARKIIRPGRARDALLNISNSPRVSSKVVDLARGLLQELAK